ncbi:putative holin-like toxin [Cerasibacillus sp. JNUCC 74]
MNVYEVFMVLFAFGSFLVAFLTLIIRFINKK